MLLNEKGDRPHIIVMTATPIPRTLAMVLFGDMDNSILNEKPQGRQEIITTVKEEIDRHDVYQFVETELKKGRQAFVITPLIEESEIMQHQERLFERFYRVDKSRSRKVGGTGLGLSIVKHIAALFEAELQLESEPGKGSTFRLIFK